MSHRNFATELAALHTRHAGQVDALDRNLAKLDAEQSELTERIGELRRQREAITDEIAMCLARKEDVLRIRPAEESVLFQERLGAGRELATGLADKWAHLQHLRGQRSGLLASDPALAAAFESYIEFEAAGEAALQGIPSWHQSALLAAHEELKARVQPLLAIRDAEAAVQVGLPLALPLAVTDLSGETQICWVLPFAAKVLSAGSEAEAVSTLAADVVQGLERFARCEDWYFLDTEVTAWGEHLALVATAEYTGATNLAEVTASLLTTELQAVMPSIEIQCFEMSAEVFEAGKGAPRAAEEEPAAVPDSPSLEEQTEGWYRDTDLISWSRPLKVAEGSLWNHQARRLRTLLIRMVGRGIIGRDHVVLEQLIAGLPEPHRESIREGVTEMISGDVLLAQGGDSSDRQRVTVNPAFLEEVQSLINRDMTEFWASMLQSGIAEEAAPEQG